MLILEVVGDLNLQGLQPLLHPGETLEHIPYAALGDFTLRIHTPRNDEREMELLQDLDRAGLQVIGYRWKRVQRAVPGAQVQPTPPRAGSWMQRLFAGRTRNIPSEQC